MLRWCAYCQNFMGESAPYDDFSWTDGICTNCKADYKSNKPLNREALEEKIQFFRTLRVKAFKGEVLNPQTILTRAEELKIRAGDVLVGVIQPILCEIGNLFEQGKISTIEEHRFSVLTDKILNHFENRYSQELADKKTCVVLASANQNYHTIGVRILTLLLQAEGIQVTSIVPSVPAEDLARLCRDLKPKVLGISLFAEDQLAYVNDVLKILGNDRPNLISVGGFLFKDKVIELDSKIYVPNPRDVKEMLSRFKEACST